ncbi:MAG TPA: DUF6278 family protein [Ktedonobacteraceae bacterium]|nr:DUF6278 family protein [Ktedonobacteraceae bacterium]
MPFTESFLALKASNNVQKFALVYVPENESVEAFKKDLDAVLKSAQCHVLESQERTLPETVAFGITESKDPFAENFQAALREKGFQPDADTAGLWCTTFPLSWEQDAQLKTLQARLLKQVYMGHPASVYDVGELVAAHNAHILRQAMRETLEIELDNSPESLSKLDELITMHESAKTWQFRVFTRSLLVACGDYTGEVMRRQFPGARWAMQARPLVVKGETFAPRDRALELCCQGPKAETLTSLVRSV